LFGVNRTTKDNRRKFYNTAFNARKNIKQMSGSFKPKWVVNEEDGLSTAGIRSALMATEKRRKRRIMEGLRKYLKKEDV
jgi:hypothetical protein